MEKENNNIQEQLLETGFNREVYIDESSPKQDELPQKSLINLFTFDCFILLGDPGIGKTFSFEHSAKYESSIYQTVEAFRITRGKNCKGKTLYLDGLDEYRSRNDDKSLIFDLIDIINEVEPLKIRISCRSADWLGAADVSKFKTLFNGNYAVATLQALTAEQQSRLITAKGITDTKAFFDEAEKHGLDNLLGNPQTLIMMTDVVRGGKWPESKIELFEKSCEKLLAEHDSNRTRSGSGEYKPDELIDTAGAICASILISNTHTISFLGQPENPQIPSYRDLTFCEEKKLSAALTRRAFTSNDLNNESLTYIHRTIAEYLAAKWIAKLINVGGLPINRIKNMIGYNDTPSSELRGLHAWLAILVNDDIAHLFIESDPLGIVLYSDPSALSPSNKIALIKSLERLSIEDPWFRWQNWSDRNLGAFSSNDLADEFIKILLNPVSSHHLKDLILGALKYGKPIISIASQLIEFLNSDYSSIEEKIDTAHILSSIGNEHSKYLATEFYPKISAHTEKYRRLQIALLKMLYPDNLFIEDVSDLIRDIACTDKDAISGEIYGLETVVRKNELAVVLEQTIAKLNAKKDDISRDSMYEVRELIKSIVNLALENQILPTPEQLWTWLEYLHRFPGYEFKQLQDETILNWVNNNAEVVDKVFEYSFTQYDNPYLWLNDFNNSFGFPYSNEKLLLNSLKLLTDKKYNEGISLDFYSYISNLIFNNKSEMQNQAFDIWFEFAEENHAFLERRESLLNCSLDCWEYRNAQDAIKRKKERLERKDEERRNIELTLNQIKSGEHLHNIGCLAYEYFRDLKHETKPIDTLIEKFGEDFIPDILQGFKSVLSRKDLPTPKDILRSKGTYYTWWKAILVAINECYEKDKSLLNIKPSILETGYVLSKIFSVFQTVNDNTKSQITLEWVNHYRTHHNNNYRNLLIDLIEEDIKLKVEHSNYIYDLKQNESTKEWRSQEAFKLLKKYPNSAQTILSDLLSITLNENDYTQELSLLADNILTKKGYLKGENRAIWLVIGFLLSPDTFSEKLLNYCKTRPTLVWTIKNLTNEFLKDSKTTGRYLNIPQLEALVSCCGVHFENSTHPSGGWSGRRNKWDASDFIKNLITQISAIPSEAATLSLDKISNNINLSSYKEHSLHSLANQKRGYAENNYHQPDWKETLSILSNTEPTNNIDLFALVHDHLKTIQKELIGSSTDLYKRFWKHGQKGAMSEPDIEDLCRDRLIEILRPSLSSFRLNTERECDMANHKRADIAVFNTNLKLPLELKRDTHKDIWLALQNQLKRLYSIDPNASGYGIYVVFWFGNNRKGRIPKPPNNIKKPTSATEMENSLKSLISNKDIGKLDVVVLDCSLPN